ncbi:replicative DNA helicase [Paeniglutamicibacter psychrophenolicus]|nr:replicative DNA helicase [Paeniglutamicibacter psychrophenolicus]MDQ0092807.1 replicative DNA helicase [Paeniglutamicibacter psychrophenolicus]
MSLASTETSSDSQGSDYGRTPPQDLVAEQSVLGGMMLSKDAIADCVEVLRGLDFYRPAHEAIYEAIIDLYGRGEPADAVTVSDLLTKRGEITRIGGPAYLHTLIQSVPTAANAGFYAEIVRERAVLRRLVDAGTKIVQLGYSQDGEVDAIVNEAQAEVYKVAERRTAEDYVPLRDIIEGTVDEIESAGSRGEGVIGVPTGIFELDELTQGLHGGQMIVIAARPAVGKALALDTPIPTPTGWSTMGALAVGDEVLAADGTPTVVTAATEVMVDRPCFEIEFNDGSVIVADAEHQWLTTTRAERRIDSHAASGGTVLVQKGTIRTTLEILDTLRCETADSRLNHAVPTSKSLVLPEAELPIRSYTLGIWLGDGASAASRITSADAEVVSHIEADGYRVKSVAKITYSVSLPSESFEFEKVCVVCGNTFVTKVRHVRSCSQSCGGKARFVSEPVPTSTCTDCGVECSGGLRCEPCRLDHGSLQALLRSNGLLNNKHIPLQYLRASESQRRDLLAGLLDSDGTVTSSGCVQFAVTSKRLATDFRELVHTLGYRTGWSEKRVAGHTESSSTCYIVTFATSDIVFGLSRKRDCHAERDARATSKRTTRFITDVRSVPSVPVRCIQVSNEEHLFLAGENFIPTHNSTFALDFARSASIKNNMTSVFFSLEMGRNEIAMRLLSAEASIALQNLRKGTIQDEEWSKIATTMGRLNDAPLFIDDSPNMSLMEIRAKCRRLKQKHDLKLVVLDYLQLMSSGKKVESRQQEVSEFSRALKLLAKELDVPVIALSQLNRGSEQRTDKKPMISDLRESGSIEQDADMVILLHREDIYDKESARAGEADVIVAKHRNGPTKTIVVAFQGHYSRFNNMAQDGMG